MVFPFEIPNRQFMRKEQSDFGWDWGPAFAPAGPWRPGRFVQFAPNDGLYELNVDIDIYRLGQFNNFIPDETQPWVVNASIDFLGTLPKCHTLQATITDDKDARSVLFSGPLQNVTSNNMTTTGVVIIDSNKPNRWWPVGLGEQNLYNISVEVVDCSSEKTTLESTRRTGFRTIVMDTGNVTQSQIDMGWQPGNNWQFLINGHEMYCKGSNLVPPDAFWPRTTPDRVIRLFDSALAQGQNMIRVWSSGAYLPDFMYDLADEMGFLMWSEFEFSDTLYPDDPAFKESVVGEVTYNVRRLNHHPSMASWVSGNEFENLMLPIEQAADPVTYPYYVGQYEDLMINTIFRTLVSNTHSLSFNPSSAGNGWMEINLDLPVAMVERYYNTTPGYIYGDTDFYNYDPSVSFDTNAYPVGRFANEFGFHSMPSLQTWQQVLEPGDLTFNSSVVVARNHHNPMGGLGTTDFTNSLQGMGEMTMAVQAYYPIPDKTDSVANFSAWCHATQIFQAEMYKSEIQFYRRGSGFPNRQRGSLYWQLNDEWQAPTWAAIEYDGRWKVLPYYAKNIYSNIIISPFYNYTSGQLDLWVTSDLWDTASGLVTMTWLDLSGKPIPGNAGMPPVLPFTVGGLNTTKILTVEVLSGSNKLKIPDVTDSILLLSLTGTGHRPNSNTPVVFTHENSFAPTFPNKQKLRDPKLSMTYDQGTQKFVVEATGAVSLYTWLTHPNGTMGYFDDNGFVLQPGVKKEVGFTMTANDLGSNWWKSVTIESIWDQTQP